MRDLYNLPEMWVASLIEKECDRYPLDNVHEVGHRLCYGNVTFTKDLGSHGLVYFTRFCDHLWELRWCEHHEAYHIWRVKDED
jgi:hypothetical protein